MKYELPKSLKRHSFWCEDISDLVNYSKCTKYCRKVDRLSCWKKKLVDDLVLDCNVNNERESENYARCPQCKSDNVVGCAFGSFMCSDCGATFSLDDEGYRAVLGENYQEIDNIELDVLLSKIKE